MSRIVSSRMANRHLFSSVAALESDERLSLKVVTTSLIESGITRPGTRSNALEKTEEYSLNSVGKISTSSLTLFDKSDVADSPKTDSENLVQAGGRTSGV